MISETARVLKPGGLYLFDTVNRTLQSKLVAIKIAQEWPYQAQTRVQIVSSGAVAGSLLSPVRAQAGAAGVRAAPACLARES